ncbi:hypothetical protein MMC11_000662 [Xylographa trunciseda]|nr:hypothetical protein [Xylographa trunciseda]
MGPMFQALPQFLRRTGYQNPTDGTDVVIQQAFQTDLDAYQWLGAHPSNLEWFNQYMSSRRNAAESWLSAYPVKEETKDWSPEKAVFVNMGGGIGHQCAEFKAMYPSIPGHVILQDLPQTIEKAMQTPGVETMAHSFFTPQPVQGAKFYFLRGVLHNWNDEKVTEILRNIVPAMSDQSLLLIDDLVLPGSEVHEFVTAIDLTMMCALAAIERTSAQWEALLGSAGLELRRHYYYKPSLCEGVMVVGRKAC